MSNTGRQRIIAAILMSALSMSAMGLSSPAQADTPAAASAGPVVLPAGSDPEAANRAAMAAGGDVSAAAARFGPYDVENVRSGKCLAIQNAGASDNARALQFTCDDVAPHNDDWYFDEISPGSIFYHLVNRHSGKCLAIQNASSTDNARALQFTCDTVAPHNDDWYLVDLSPNNIHVHIVNRHSGRCLTVQNASLNNNAAILQFGCDVSPPYNEQWRLL